MSIDFDLTEEEQGYLLFARNVYAIYEGDQSAASVVALRGINLKMKPGEFIAVVGPSGSGKSTLLRIMGGLQRPSAGVLSSTGTILNKLTEDELVQFRRNMVGYVFQEGNLIPTLSALDNLRLTLKFSGVGSSEAKKWSIEVLDQLGMKHRMNALPLRLSGGERQRVAVGRALVNRPKIILADEPTGNLDYDNSENIMGLFKELHDELETSFFIVTHSKHLATYADRSIELRDGRFIAQHGAELDLEDLQKSRRIIMEGDGTLVLPPEISTLLANYGNLWNFRVEMEDDLPNLIGRPSFTSDAAPVKTKKNCPVCGKPVNGNQFTCKSCGASLHT